jgi:hypothetical protein
VTRRSSAPPSARSDSVAGSQKWDPDVVAVDVVGEPRDVPLMSPHGTEALQRRRIADGHLIRSQKVMRVANLFSG